MTTQPRVPRHRNGYPWAVVLAAGLVMAGVCPSLQAVVRALPTPAANHIDPSSLGGGSPQVSGPDNPVRDRRLQILRALAQSGGTPPRGARTQTSSAAADAAWLLGLLALHGLAMPPDPPQAQQWFERAQVLGHPLAPAGVAWCQISGCVTRPNPTAALPWIARLRHTEPGLAKYLEWHATQALAPLPEPVQIAQRLLLMEAARAGNAQAGNELGLEHLAAGERERALAQFQAVAPRSEAAATNASVLASRIRSGVETPPRAVRYGAGDWYLEGLRYHRGDGVPANYAEAIRLYQVAASGGDARARRILELIFSRLAPSGGIDIAWMQQLTAIDVGSIGMPQNVFTPVTPHGWQRDPSPLYAWVPNEWRTSAPSSVR